MPKSIRHDSLTGIVVTGCLLLIIVYLTVGCADIVRPTAPAYSDPHIKALQEKYSKTDAIPTDQTGMTAEKRNTILEDLVYMTDRSYNKFESQLRRTRSIFETVTDLALLGIGAAGATGPGAGTSAILAATSAGIAGSRVSINKNIFQDKTTELLIAQMRAGRLQKLEEIRKGELLSVEQYTLSRGVTDVGEYYNAGRLETAFQGLLAAAGQAQADATKELKYLIQRQVDLKFSTDAETKDLRPRIQKWLDRLDTSSPEGQKTFAKLMALIKEIEKKKGSKSLEITPALWIISATTTKTDLLEVIDTFKIPE